MHLAYAGFIVFIFTALPLLVLGSAVGTVLLALSGGLFAIMLFIVGASEALWRLAKQDPRPTLIHPQSLPRPQASMAIG